MSSRISPSPNPHPLVGIELVRFACTPPVLIKVPLRQTPSGPKARRLAIRYRVYANGNNSVTDRDVLRLKCTP